MIYKSFAATAITSLILVGGLVLHPASASAMHVPAHEAQNAPLRANATTDTTEFENLYRLAVSFVNGELIFDAVTARQAGVSEQVIQEYEIGLAVFHGEVPDSLSPQAQSLLHQVRAMCRGKNERGVAPWGPYAQLDSCNTTRLVALLASGSGVAAVAALDSSATGAGALAGGLVSGILAIGAGAVSYCSADGNGVVLRILWNGAPYCTGP